MANPKRVFTLRMKDEVFDKIAYLADHTHRSMTNYIEHVLLTHLKEYEEEHGLINLDVEE